MDKNAAKALYRERVLPGLGFYFATAFVPVAVYLILLAFNADVAIFCLIGSELVVVFMSVISAPIIELSNHGLRVGKALLPVNVLGEALLVPPENAFNERGKNLDTRAFTRFQVGVKSLIKISLKDQEDPTPYLLFSTRRPEKIAEELKRLAS